MGEKMQQEQVDMIQMVISHMSCCSYCGSRAATDVYAAGPVVVCADLKRCLVCGMVYF